MPRNTPEPTDITSPLHPDASSLHARHSYSILSIMSKMMRFKAHDSNKIVLHRSQYHAEH